MHCNPCENHIDTLRKHLRKSLIFGRISIFRKLWKYSKNTQGPYIKYIEEGRRVFAGCMKYFRQILKFFCIFDGP